MVQSTLKKSAGSAIVMKTGVCLLSLAALFLAACGDFSGSRSDSDEVEKVPTRADLGSCKGADEGTTKLVTAENKFYTCTNGQWNFSGSYIDTVKTKADMGACLRSHDDSVFVMEENAVFYCQNGLWESRGPAMGDYEATSDLPDCDEMSEGLRSFVKKDSTVYVCDGNGWKAWADAYASEGDLPNCGIRLDGARAWLLDVDKAMVCKGGSWEESDDGDGQNGGEDPQSSDSGEYDTPSSPSSEGGDSGLSSSSGTANPESSSEEDGPEWYSSDSVLSGSSSDGSIYDASAKTLTDLRDGHIYKTVQIGDQVWMKQNLNYRYLGRTRNLDSTSFCYRNATAYCSKFGRLYTWSAAIDSVGIWATGGKGCGYGGTCTPTYPVRGICPKGWHLPSRSEWGNLFTAVGGSSTAGRMLKSTSGWKNKGNGDDTYGFTALPAGCRTSDGSACLDSAYAEFWSSSEYGTDDAINMAMDYEHGVANTYYANKNKGCSVRCLKD